MSFSYVMNRMVGGDGDLRRRNPFPPPTAPSPVDTAKPPVQVHVVVVASTAVIAVLQLADCAGGA